ncbi:MAG TPA: DUF3343 domain-containing protein [Limnochordia bacterium]|jgi:hypothetical protein|nr:DUF3343 domain-containing protein [Limnochordia bacterium]
MGEQRVVITFQTTTQAMAWERACKERGLPGRLIPMPVVISADCGVAWLAAPEELELLLSQAEELGLGYDQVVELK